MKKNRIFGALSAAALLVAGACSNDVLAPESENGANAINPEDGVYLAVTFDLPTAKGTRSYTDGDNSSNSGTEVGTDEENKVTSTLLVLATTSNEYIGSAIAEGESIVAMGTTGTSYKSTNKFTKTSLNDYYQKVDELNIEIDPVKGNHKVNVFVFCNPTDGLKDVFENIEIGDSDWVNKKGVWEEPNTVAAAAIWEDNKFLMGNSSICTRLFPSNLDAWNDFIDESSAFNLSGMNNYGRPSEIDNFLDGEGVIKVERAAARYDFRDGALDTEDAEPQTYHVLLDSDENPLVDVFLGKMSMVNMNKNFYFLRRVSNNGREGATMTDGQPNNYRLLGPELPWYTDDKGTDADKSGNYVVDADSQWKYSGTAVFNKGAYSTYFNFPFFNDEGGFDNNNEGGIQLDQITGNWYTSLISEVLSNNKEKNDNYHVWRYLTEGTIPGSLSQKNGVSNGIAFKGIMQPARQADEENDDDFTKKLLQIIEPRATVENNGMNEPILFLFGGHLYATWDHIRRAAIGFAINDLTEHTDGTWTFSVNRSSSTLYNKVFGNGGFGTVTFKKLPDGKVTFLTTETEGDDIVTITDPVAQDTSSPNYLYNEWRTEPVYDDQFTAFRRAAVAKKIALYTMTYDEQMDKWGYYCNYYYWNRHNNNGKDGVMGPMEFAVVRNNVYKLAVTKLSRIGHPQDPKNDPEVPTPNTPDESGDVYITVTCTTLPWVVRENTIEF